MAIVEWATDAPQDVLARLGARTATALALRIPPIGATIRRIIKDTCPGGLADLLGRDPAGADTLAIDGKSARGSRLGGTPAANLLAAMTGTGMTVTQLRVPEKTNERPILTGTPWSQTGGAHPCGWLLPDLEHSPFSLFACSISSLVATLSLERGGA